MKILQIQDNRLEVMLSPLASLLDGYWWWIGGAGAMPGDLLAANDLAALRRWSDEYATFIQQHDIIGRVARPGYFSRYAGAMDCDWDVYCASDAAEPPLKSFWVIQQQRLDWFAAFKSVPTDIALIARVIDGGYWDLFFRDDWLFDMIELPLRGGALTSASWLAFASEKEFDQRVTAQWDGARRSGRRR